MRASHLRDLIPGATMKGPDSELNGVSLDSRKVKSGMAFVALKGTKTDGHNFIKDALINEASCIICNAGKCPPIDSVGIIEVMDTKESLPVILRSFYPHADKLRLIGITGTNGKTTTAYLIESIMRASGMVPGAIGTIETRFKGKAIPSSITTPGPAELFEILSEMKLSGVDACVMEVTSHALDQDRIDGLIFKHAVFMNLSQDHLDYHKDMEDYFKAKKKLFTDNLDGTALINTDDPYGKRLVEQVPSLMSFGFNERADIRPISINAGKDGISASISTPQGDISIKSNLLGDVQVYNIMAAVGVALDLRIAMDEIKQGIEALSSIPGRMERIPNPQGLDIIVDFAHTPHALENAIKTAKAITGGKVITVFGCGGDRDRGKRPLMGKIASMLSDLVVITSDNPRTEDPGVIIKDILSGIDNLEHVLVEQDRHEAIKKAIEVMSKDDCLLVAGKGHEKYQIVGQERIPFDDKTNVLECIEEVYKD